MKKLSPCVIALSLALAACGDDDAPSTDAGHDANQRDGQADSAIADASGDAHAGHDAADDHDAGADDRWLGCPTAADFIGPGSGSPTVTANDDAVYCVMFNESQSFAEAYASKAMIKIAAGSYPLGMQSGVEVMLPTCIRTAGATHPSIMSAAAMTYMTSAFEGQTDHVYSWTSAVQNAGVIQFLQTRFDINVAGAGTPSITLDGTHPEPFEYENVGRASFYFCEGDPLTACGRALLVDSCSFDNARLHRHTLTFGGAGGTLGDVTFELRIGQSPASTEPGAFVGAHGHWGAQAFEQRDYFKLVYVPAHHHFERNFIVLFDAPIGGACGLRVSGISQYEEELDQGQAATVNCDLEDIASLAITGHTHMLVE